MSDFQTLQNQYDKIYNYFKNTTEPFDLLEWDGNTLEVVLNDKTVEIYSRNFLKTVIFGL